MAFPEHACPTGRIQAELSAWTFMLSIRQGDAVRHADERIDAAEIK
jgi:hypothetical protein